MNSSNIDNFQAFGQRKISEKISYRHKFFKVNDILTKMAICSNCKRKFPFWNSCSIEGIEGVYCEDCYDNYKNEIMNKKKKEEEKEKKAIDETKNKIMEYKRKCNQCGKIWHSLVKEEKRAMRGGLLNSLVGMGTAIGGNLGASTQSSRNADANLESLQNRRRCPNCGSADYTEEIITFKKK